MLCMLAGGLLEASAASGSCWSGEWTFDLCCRTTGPSGIDKPYGERMCWGDGFSYQTCCLPEKEARIEAALQGIKEGRFREVSDEMARLALAHTSPADGSDFPSRVMAAWEKATTSWKRTLNAIPDSLTYIDVLFGGLGVNCSAASDGTALPHADWVRCCWKQGGDVSACARILGMLQTAISRTRPDLEAYYEDFAEQWSFRHFTPSVLGTDDHIEEVFVGLTDLARKIDRAVFAALSATPEPTLGIPWAEHVAGFTSVKTNAGYYFLTVALSHIRRHLGLGAWQRPLHVIEMGAGYGSLPRMLICARGALATLEPPINLAGYTIFDVLPVSMLQRWYLSKTLGDRVEIRDWTGPGEDATWRRTRDGVALRLGARSLEAAVPVHLVDTEHRDIFAHMLQRADAGREDEASRPLRLVFAVNSWHEMPLNEFAWYYNEFLAGPVSRLRADWVLYVSNAKWPQNDDREAMLEAIAGRDFETVYEHRYPNRVRLWRCRHGV